MTQLSRFPYQHNNFERFKDRVVFVKQDVEVYFNLHLSKWSIRDTKTKLVLGHSLLPVCLANARFVVNEGGRQRVIVEKKKNVHAYARGLFLGLVHRNDVPQYGFSEVSYNPYKMGKFFLTATNTGLDQSNVYERCYLAGKKAYVNRSV